MTLGSKAISTGISEDYVNLGSSMVCTFGYAAVLMEPPPKQCCLWWSAAPWWPVGQGPLEGTFSKFPRLLMEAFAVTPDE